MNPGRVTRTTGSFNSFHAEGRCEIADKCFYFAISERKAMIGFAPCAGHLAFHCVQPVHVRAVAAPPPVGETAGVPGGAWAGSKKVGIERKHDIRVFEPVISVHRPAEGKHRTGARRMT